MPNAVRLLRTLTLRIPAPAFFDLATMTDRVERAAGLPAARFQMTREPGGRPALRADARLLGVPVHWYELPFEWVDGHYWRVHRIFEGVPLKWIIIDSRIEPLDAANCRVVMQVDVMPTNILGRVGAYFVFGTYTMNQMMRVYRTLERRYVAQEPTIFPTAVRPHVNRGLLDARARELRAVPGLSPAIVSRLLVHLQEGLDDEVKAMRPFVLADRWGADRMATLRVFLYATRAGLLDLHWDVLCPNCRVAKNQVGSLADLSREAHCDTCNIRYDVNFDEYVELRFTVSDAVREVYQATFCIAAPYQTRHILAQFNLAPGNTHTLAVDFGPGTYRWRTRQRTERGDVQVGPDGGPGPLHYRFTAGDVDGPVGTPALRPGGAIHFENSSGTDLLLIFEQAGWGLDGVSAALVTSLQEFRTLFSSQVLAPGLSVAVKNLTVLFSDLKESTTLYDRMGDSAAYASVRDHFVIMSNTIAAHNGAVVKTIGDAVMAVFSTPSHAVEACLAIQRGITLYNETATDDHITVKLGLHSGPCLAINANDVLDYFGSTVNIASRVQGASGGADVILTDRVYADPAVHHLLAGLPVQSFTASLKGISQVFTLYRVVPNSPMTAPPLRALAGTA